eukprot:5553000-Alexandrium_andersonii.AAC.1
MPRLRWQADQAAGLAVVSTTDHCGRNNHKTGMVGEISMPRRGHVVRLTGLRRHGDPVQPRPVARAGRPPGRATRAGDGQPAFGQPRQDGACHLDLTVVARLGQI